MKVNVTYDSNDDWARALRQVEYGPRVHGGTLTSVAMASTESLWLMDEEDTILEEVEPGWKSFTVTKED